MATRDALPQCEHSYCVGLYTYGGPLVGEIPMANLPLSSELDDDEQLPPRPCQRVPILISPNTHAMPRKMTTPLAKKPTSPQQDQDEYAMARWTRR